jgi:hypothetical protein
MPKKRTEELTPVENDAHLIARDMFGNPITKGTYLAFPVRRRAQMWMSVARVRRVKWEMNKEYRNIPTLFVWVVGETEMANGEIDYNPRKTTVNIIDRAIVLPQGYVDRWESPEKEILVNVPLNE